MTLDEWLRMTGTPVQTVASLCDVHPTTVLRWRAMERKPRPRQMAALTRVTGWHVRARDFGIDVHRGSPYFLRRDDVSEGGAASAEVEGRGEGHSSVAAEGAAGAHGARASPHQPRRHDSSITPHSGLAEVRSAFGTATPEAEAAALGLDAAAIAETAIREAIRAEKARRWLAENREAIEAHNRWLEEHGLPLAEYRMF